MTGENTEEEDSEMNTEAIRYRDGVTALTGFLAWDETTVGKRPGILVVHGGAGLDEHAKGRAQCLADLGYVVFACDMYGDGIAGDRQRVMARVVELRDDPRQYHPHTCRMQTPRNRDLPNTVRALWRVRRDQRLRERPGCPDASRPWFHPKLRIRSGL